MASLPPPALQPALRTERVRRYRFAAPRAITALILREMSTRYGRTPGGYLWAILEPLAGILVLSVGFSLVMRTPPIGSSFLLFYASGYMPFDLYNVLARMVSKSIGFSKSLLMYPAVTWVDAVIARFLLNSLTGILVTILLIGGILLVTETRTVLDLPPMILATVLAMLLGLGMGTLNCALIGLFPIWDVAWSIITRPLFIASGIFFLYDTMPPLAKEILWYNPLIHVTGLARTAFYPMYNPQYISATYVLSVSLALLAMGLILLGRYHRDILNR